MSIHSNLSSDAVKCKDGNIRLVPLNQQQADQMQVIEGRLEICFHGIWGAVFDKDWSPNDVLVACRQLGFRSSIGMYISHYSDVTI